MPGAREERVLVVDDAESVCLAISSMLQNQGYEVLAATNYADALTQARRQNIGIALIDVHLGAHSGLDLAEVMLAENPRLTVLIISGSVLLDQELQSRPSLKKVAVLQKPFTRHELVDSITKAVKERAA